MKTAISVIFLVTTLLISFSLSPLAGDAGGETPRGIPEATVFSVGPAGAPEGIESPIERMGYGDFRGVIHAHSYLSHDSKGTPARMIQAANTVGVQFILMSDHSSPYSVSHGMRGMHGGVLFLPGLEIGIDEGCLLSLNLREDVSGATTQDKIDNINAQGGIAFLGHIEGIKNWDLEGYAGMEIYNAHYDALYDGSVDRTFSLARHIEDTPDRVWQSILDIPQLYLDRWDEQLAKRRVTGVAANDSHENVVYNGFQLDTYERSYGLVNTHLFLMELSEDGILDALRKGHAYVCFEVFAPCRGFSFTAADDENIGIMGDEFRIKEDKTPKLEISLPRKALLKLMRDGDVFKEEMTNEMTLELKEPGVYRVEVYVKPGKQLKPWIYSNPIYVR